MRYWKVSMSNGYCGCEEVEMVKTEDNEDLHDNADAYMQGYSFYEPDSRFIGDEDSFDSEEEYQEAYDEYIDGLSISIEELTYEKYLNECENEGVEP